MATTLVNTDFNFPGQTAVYHGKVRDVYSIGDDLLVMVATDRISAFDVILPKGIPYKGQALNQIAASMLDATADLVPNWKIAVPDPMVTVGYRCEGLRLEMIIRGYLAGSAWREYKAGMRELCGVKLPEGMVENQRFPEPIITPTTKADAGHDENISREEAIAQGIVTAEQFDTMAAYTRALFKKGSEMAAEKGLILVDTKYEFGLRDGKVILIDEIHTPDSSRYFYAEGYEERLAKGEPQKQLSKEFVREWLMANGFMGKEGQQVPEMTDAFCEEVSERYRFLKSQIEDIENSRTELNRLIDELTMDMQSIFTENFSQISEHFAQVFTQLFDGGRGELSLTDPQNVLDSGIEIYVQPPGKIIKNLAALSGGEQAFVAIAIYFAILKVRPSPFVLLDEIEAALDDVNVVKYAQYLRTMCGKTQFIAITHRRGTMEEADVLYGVTMQEEGVSKLLELNVGEIESKLGIS